MAAGQRQYCYVDFNVVDEVTFHRLAAVVEEFKRQKDSNGISDEAHWLPYFDDSDRNAFWWPSEAEVERWDQFWFSTPLPQRHGPTMPTPPWHFGSMVEAILQGDYDLIGLCKQGDGRSRLEFDPHGYPYGGIDSLRTLVRAFGHEITGYDDGTGFAAGDVQSPRWTPDMKIPNRTI